MDEDFLRFDKEKALIFIDCETLNLCLNSSHNLPWQISMIKANGDKKVDEKDYLIKWNTDLKISEDAARITRYSQSKVNKMGVKPEEVFPTIKDWLDNADYIIGHNILGFDIYLIKDLYELYGEDWSYLMPKIIDTHCIAKGVKLGLPYAPESDFLAYQYRMYHTRKRGLKTRLGALGVEFDIEHDYDKLHDALVDLELNLKVWNKLKWQLEF